MRAREESGEIIVARCQYQMIIWAEKDLGWSKKGRNICRYIRKNDDISGLLVGTFDPHFLHF